MHATDSEWYALVKEGVERKIFGEISYEGIFKDKAGNPVLNGAMGVDKIRGKWKTGQPPEVYLYSRSDKYLFEPAEGR